MAKKKKEINLFELPQELTEPKVPKQKDKVEFKVGTEVPKATNTKDEDVLKEARLRFRQSYDFHRKNFDEAREDVLFVSGDQWPADIMKDRSDNNRPMLTVNKLRTFIKQVVGEQRQSRPQIKVHPAGGKATKQTAEVIQGLSRNIEVCSNADEAYDHAFHDAVLSGWGWFRYATEYVDDDIFEQDIRIRRVPNKFSVLWDPMAVEPHLNDGMYMFVTDDMSKEEYEGRWPGKSVTSWDIAEDDRQYWFVGENPRVCEYFRKVAKTKTIYLLADGRVVYEEDRNPMELPVKSREVKSYDIEWYLLSGGDVLEGPEVWPGRYWPLIPVWGEELWVEGYRMLNGLIRDAKDPQRLYNYSRTNYAECVALQPRVPYLVTPEMIEGHEEQWRSLSKRNFDYLLFNTDPATGAKPFRESPPQLSSGMIQDVTISDMEIKATTGLFDPSLGQRQSQQSGKAIQSLQRKGDISTFSFQDNLTRSITWGGLVLIDLLPRIYDTQREVRILGLDDKPNKVVVNRMVGPGPGLEPIIEHNLTTGKYDVTVTIGPSFATQRLEAANSMMEFIRNVPKEIATAIMPLIADALDWPMKEKFMSVVKQMVHTMFPAVKYDDDEQGPQKPPTQMEMMQMQKLQLELQQQQLDMQEQQTAIKEKQAKIEKILKEVEAITIENQQLRIELAKEVHGVPKKVSHKDEGTGISAEW